MKKMDIYMMTDIRAVTPVSETYIATAISKNYVGDWMKNDWKTKKGRDVVSKDLWQQLMYLLSTHQCTVVYDISHEYSRWMADELTRKEKKKK